MTDICRQECERLCEAQFRQLALTEGNVSDLVARPQLKEGGNRHTGSNCQHVKLAPMYLRREFRPLTENKFTL